MIYDKALAVASLRPYKAWSWAGEDYSNFIWQDSGTAPTEDEINAELTRLTNEEPMRLLRLERNKRLTACDWIITMHKELGTNIPAAWKTYRQALRDLPANTTDPRSPSWPTQPS